MIEKYNRLITPYLFIAPALLILILVIFIPLFIVFRLSFYDMDLVKEVFIGFNNYRIAFFEDPKFWNAFKNTIIFSFTSVFLDLTIGFIIALVLNNISNSGWLRAMLIIPWIVSPVVAGLLWKWMFNIQFGIINAVLINLRLTSVSISWLTSPRLALLSCIMANVWKRCPFMMVMILAGLKAIPKEFHEAGDVDGANYVQKLFYITIPSILDILLISVLLDIIWNFKIFDLIFIMTGGGPGNASEVLATMIYKNAFNFYKYGYSSSLAVIMLLFLLIPVIIYIVIIKNRSLNE